MLPPSGRIFWCNALQLIENSGGKPLVHNIVCEMAEVLGPIQLAGRIIQPAKAEHFAVVVIGERLNPRAQFLCNKRLQDLGEIILGPKFLISRSLVYERDNSDMR